MREAVGGTLLLKIVLIFLVVYIGFMAIILNYGKTFRIKNRLINYIEQEEGIIKKEELDDYECWIENISDEYQSFKQLSKSLVDYFTDARLEEFEGDRSALAVDSKYTVTVFVGDEKVYEETVTCR